MKHAPFDITPNPRFLFHSSKHREAFNHLLYGVRKRKGFVQLTGEVGAGKTTLCRALLDQLDSHFSTALILNPVLGADELMQAIAMEFGLNVSGEDRRETVAAISEFLLRQLEYGKETVLIIDEAQNLTEDLLEQVRLLSNIETDDRKLLQIVLMGQPELRDRLNSPRLKQLRQRITVRFHLAPLSRNISGTGSRFLARKLLHFSRCRPFNYSGGITRLVNAVCDKALLAGFVRRSARINYAMVGRAIRELEGNIYA
jgi:general secretion pathway protein A